MRIYLDLCCLNRPFDDQVQRRVHLEAQAVTLILESFTAGEHELCGSTALFVECSQDPNMERRQKTEAILDQATIWVPYRRGMDRRVLQFRQLGFHVFDAYHIASAEAGGCERLVTCDDRFLKVARRNAAEIQVIVTDPIRLVSEADF